MVVEVLLEIVWMCDLYLVVWVVDDVSEGLVMGVLEVVGLFLEGKLNWEKVLFCSMEMGRMFFVW